MLVFEHWSCEYIEYRTNTFGIPNLLVPTIPGFARLQNWKIEILDSKIRLKKDGLFRRNWKKSSNLKVTNQFL